MGRPTAFSELSASVDLQKILGKRGRTPAHPSIERGMLEVAETADIAGLARPPSRNDGADRRAHATAASVQPVSAQALQRAVFTRLTSVPADAWRSLAERAIEPNAYYLPAWELAVNASADGRTGAFALSAW